MPSPTIQVVILMGSPSDKGFCEKIQSECKKLGVPAFMRVTSAHKGTDETLNVIAQYEGSMIFYCFLRLFFILFCCIMVFPL